MSTISKVDTNQFSDQTSKTKMEPKILENTIGEVKLSDKALKYYDELQKKYSNMDFILVSEDKKQQAQAQAGSYANTNRMVVLIDSDKIERMAEDETYREQYESIISNAAIQLPKLQTSLASTKSNVKTFGMQIKDNRTASFFAVVGKSLAKQREQLTKKAEEKRHNRREELNKVNKEKNDEVKDSDYISKTVDNQDSITVWASSFEELMQKIEDIMYNDMTNNIKTESEKQVGQHVDYRM